MPRAKNIPAPIVVALREERLRQGISQGRMGEIAGYAPSHVSAVERGHQRASAEILEDLANALGKKLTLEDRDVSR